MFSYYVDISSKRKIFIYCSNRENSRRFRNEKIKMRGSVIQGLFTCCLCFRGEVGLRGGATFLLIIADIRGNNRAYVRIHWLLNTILDS